MKITRAFLAFQDERGQIYDVLKNAEFDSVSMIVSKAGTIRGNHYHKDTHQYLHVIKGSLKYWWIPTTEPPPDSKFKVKMKPMSVMAREGDVIYTPPDEIHAMKFLEEGTTFLVYTKGPRSGADYESDTFRVDNIVGNEENNYMGTTIKSVPIMTDGKFTKEFEDILNNG